MANNENKQINAMTEGNPFKLIFAFAVPLLLGNILQQVYNMVDSIVVGNYVGKIALAAVGTGFPIIFFMSSLFIGMGMGATILISQYIGAGDMENVRRTSQTIYTTMIIGSIPISILGMIFSKQILILINTPTDVIQMATQYMVVIFAGLIGSFGFNINAGILQGFGDSKSSLLFLAIATIVNILLDIVFVVVFEWGVPGVAAATIIAQALSWIFGIIYMKKKYEVLDFKITKFYFDKDIFKKVLKLGLPISIQQAVFSLGSMSMQSLVNGYGSNFMAGYNAANKIDMFAFMPIQSFANASTTYVGQNIGAGKIDRVQKGTIATLILSVSTSILGLIIIPLGPTMLKLFNSDPVVIEAGMIYLTNVMPLYILLSILFTLNSVIRGAGESIIPMIGSMASIWIGRIPSAYYIAANFGNQYLFYSYGVGWFLWLLIVVPYYLSGKWKTKSQNLIHETK